MFPSSMRSGNNDVYSRFTTELNLVNIVNRVSTGKFVSGSYLDNGNLWIDFTLLGYHFEANIQSLIAGSNPILEAVGDHLYACAIVGYAKSSGGVSTETRYDEILKGWSNSSIQTTVDDTNGNFIGLLFTKADSDCIGLKNTLGENASWNCTCDYINLGEKGNTEFVIDTTNKPFDTDDIGSIPDETINRLWG